MLDFLLKGLSVCRASVALVVAAVAVAVMLLFPVAPCAAQAQNRDLVRADAAFSAVQKRVALVIGNKEYADAPLKNPVNDAQAMAAALKDLGFDVLCKTNLTNRQMVATVSEFAQKLGPNTIGLFYFSGHGVQVDGVNYLVPIGYNIERQADVPFEAFPAQRLLSTMGGAGCPLNIVILDACRNNPLPKSIKALSGDKGLGKMDAPSGTFIAYATAPGQTASDDSEKENGLYTGVLLQKMKTPGLKIEEVFKATRVSVIDASGGRQTPWDESSITNDFYFAAGIPAAAPVVVVPGKGQVVETRGRLVVTVTDAKSGAAISGASVTVDGQSAPGGSFSLNLLTEADKAVQVLVTAPGYDGKLVSETLLRGKTVSLPVVLEAIAVPVPVPDPAPVVPVSPPPVARKVNPKDGAELILIPAGPFLMGDDDQKDNKRHTVTLSAYSIYKNLVTVGMYEKFCKATGKAMPPAPDFNAGWAKKDHPIVNVSWDDAKAYCDWAGVMLPSEAQWEKAARGTEGRKYPWGDVFDTSKLWCSTAKVGDAGGTTKVGSFASGASPYGVLDMAGNVRQWCADWYDEGFSSGRLGSLPDPVNESVGEKRFRSIRGGSWGVNYADYFRCAYRYWNSPDFKQLRLPLCFPPRRTAVALCPFVFFPFCLGA